MSEQENQKTTPDESTPPVTEDHAARIADLESKLAEAQRNAQNWEHARMLLSDSTPNEQRVQAARAAMTAAGVNPDDIESYIQSLQGGNQETNVQTPNEPPSRPTNDQDPFQMSHLQDLDQRLRQTEEHARQQQRQRANEDLERSIRNRLDSHNDIRDFIGKISDKDREGVSTFVYEDARQGVLRELAARRERFGRITQSDLDEAVTAGVKSAADKFGKLRAVIGETYQLGQSSETVAGLERLLNEPAKPYPKPGEEHSDRKLREANTDELVRMFAETATARGDRS